MTAREAIDSALSAANKIEVKGKANVLNLALVIQLLEALDVTEKPADKPKDEVQTS